jgi:hypothetical protein
MTTKDEALKLALEALGLYQAAGFGNSTDFNKQHEAFYKAQTAITAIKQAREAPVQEPVGCMRCATPKKCATWGCSPNTWPSENTTPPNVATPLAAQQEIQRLSALVRAQQITIEKLEALQPAPAQEENLYDLAVKADNGGQP